MRLGEHYSPCFPRKAAKVAKRIRTRSFAAILTFHPVSAKLLIMTSLLQTGSGMISAYACGPLPTEKRFLINRNSG